MKTFKLTINGDKYEAKILEYNGITAKVNVNGNDFLIEIEDDHPQVLPKLEQDKAVPIAPAMTAAKDAFTGEVRAPLPGVIFSIPVKEGDKVKRGQAIIVIEAMKMQSEIASPVDGIVSRIKVKERNPVQEGDLLMILESEEIKEAPAPTRNHRQNAQSCPEPVKQAADGILRAPIPGVILDLLVKAGDMVDAEQTVLILEAMKMESEIHSNRRGKVKKVYVNKGDSVQEGDPLLELEV